MTRNQQLDRQPAGISPSHAAMSGSLGVEERRSGELITHSRTASHHIRLAIALLRICHSALGGPQSRKQQTCRATRAQGCCAGSDCPKRQSRVVLPDRGARVRDLKDCPPCTSQRNRPEREEHYDGSNRVRLWPRSKLATPQC